MSVQREQQLHPVVVGTMQIVIAIVAVSTLGGLVAALVGGEATKLGNGFGGLFGVPALLLTFVALTLGTAGALATARRIRPSNGRARAARAALVGLVGLWIVATGYSTVAHAIDPCLNGWWDAGSRVGSQPVCERFGSELNWHTRFHLLAHAIPAALLLAAYVWAMRRWGGPPALAESDPVDLADR